MAEGTYEYECMRAELLGIEKPDGEVFLEAQQKAHEEELQREKLAELEERSEEIRNTTGKMDELNSILSLTQQKINKFKTSCGSLTNLLKIRSGSRRNSTDNLEGASNKETSLEGESSNTIDNALDELDTMKANENQTTSEEIKKTSVEIQKKMASQIDALDSLLAKTENAQYSMQRQNKQMKQFLK